MERVTKVLEGSNFYIEDDSKIQHDINGYSGDAINKLAKFENMYDDLLLKQANLAEELEKLRSEGKIHKVKFKQLLADKLTINNIIMLFETYGLQ